MTTLNLFRFPTRRFTNTKTQNTSVNTILENPEEKWGIISEAIKNVADMVPKGDLGESTVLGRHEGFISPFISALRMYRKEYDEKSWCKKNESQVHMSHENPFRTKKLGQDISFATKHSVPENGKVIVIGDIHSSLQSLVKIIDNLVERGIISQDFVIAEDYTIVFLGDIVDRGPFGLDLLHIIFRLKASNGFNKIFILNGNHEDFGMYSNYGFLDELESQIPRNDYKTIINELLIYLPSVLFLSVNEQIFQLNHGGIEPEYIPLAFIYRSQCDYEFHGYDGDKLYHMGLRWNDFNGNLDDIGGSKRGGNVIEFGKESTDEYLSENGLDGIIRGHQDFYHLALMNNSFSDNTQDTIPIPEIGMSEPSDSRWRSEKNGWQHIKFMKAFENFSVVTTSTAVRARDLGYHAYLELTNSRDDIQKIFTEVRSKVNFFMPFWQSMDLGSEFEMILSGDVIKNKEKRNLWRITIDQIKSEVVSTNAFYQILLIDSYIFNNS